MIKKLKMGDRKARTYIFSFDIIEIQAIKPFWFIFYNSFQIYFIICSLLSSNLYYNMGGPKNVGSCINKTNKKIRKIQNNKYLTNKCKKIYIYFCRFFQRFFYFFQITLSFVHYLYIVYITYSNKHFRDHNVHSK